MTKEKMHDEYMKKPMVKLLHMGNSLQYLNDGPGALHKMLVDSGNFSHVSHENCLRGGANLVSLHQYGTHWFRKWIGIDYGTATVEDLFATVDDREHNKEDANLACRYVFAVFNDDSRAPARPSFREPSLQALDDVYSPLVKTTKAVPIFLETAAYSQEGYYWTKDLGDFDQFTKSVQEGCLLYKAKMEAFLHPDDESRCYIAKVGTAYKLLYDEDREFWKKLYAIDPIHPSCYGTLLEAYVLYFTVMKHMDLHGTEVPKYDPGWLAPWVRLPVPTNDEAQRLCDVAKRVFDEQSNTAE